MKSQWLTITCLFVTILTTSIGLALYVALDSPSPPPARLLFVSGGIGITWQRTVQGARAAARDLGVELHVSMPTADDSPDEQSAILRTINFAQCDGVAFCPADPESQLELIKEIAEQTKLVTVGNYYYRSNALCHVGFSPGGLASNVARLILPELPLDGKIALLSCRHSKDCSDTIADMQLSDFKDRWNEWNGSASSMLRSIIVEVDNNGQMTQQTASAISAALDAPDVAFIVAFDTPSVESALRVLAPHPRPTTIPIIAAFDPSDAILNGIADGGIYAAISQDPYRDGYEGVVRAAKLAQLNVPGTLPIPGYGSAYIPSETVQKANLADFQRHTPT